MKERPVSQTRRISSLMTFRFEFDLVNKILLTRIEGRLTDELFAEPLRAFWKYLIAGTGVRLSRSMSRNLECPSLPMR
jgi:hypothetical protein